jgi:hypothetical protein
MEFAFWKEKATEPFCGVEFALRGAGLVGLWRKMDIGKERRNATGYAP